MSPTTGDVGRLLHAYAAAIDERRADDVLELFAPEGWLLTGAGDRLQGEAIREFFTNLGASESDAGAISKHFVTGVQVDAAPDSGWTVVGTFLMLRHQGESLMLTWGKYEGVALAVGDDARFSEMTIRIEAPLLVVPAAPPS